MKKQKKTKKKRKQKKETEIAEDPNLNTMQKKAKKKKKGKRNKGDLYYAKNRDLFTMNEMEIAKDPNLDTMQRAVLEQHNSKASDQLVFAKFDKVEYAYVCGGKFYFLSIGVRGTEDEDESVIEKMVWMGMSRELLETKNINHSPSNPSIYPTPEFSSLTSFVLSESTPDTPSLKLVGMQYCEEDKERHKDVPLQGGGGWFTFKVYNTIIEAKPDQGPNEFIQSSVLCRDWLQIMDDDKESSFASWKIDMLKAHRPSSREPAPKDNAYRFYPLDMRSPQVVTQVWHAIEDHNYKHGTNLEFVQVFRGQYGITTGRFYYFTFEAKLSGVATTFQFVVHENPMRKSWTLVTPLKPCKINDKYELPEPEPVTEDEDEE